MNWRKFLRLALSGGLVGWLFVVTLEYFVVHKPFGVQNGLALLSSCGDLVILSLLLVLAAAVGHRITRSFEFDSSLELIVLCIGLGWGVLSFSSYVLGLVGALSPPIFWAACLLALLVLRDDVRAFLNRLRSVRLPIEKQFEKVLALFVGATLILALIRALTPPLAWDAQVYHLVEAKYWIAQGRIAAPPDNPYFSFPSLIENLYLFALLLKGDTLAQAIHWSFLVLTLGLVLLFAQRFFSSRIGWLAASILAAVPSLVLVSSWAYVDSALAFFATAALYCVGRAENWEAGIEFIPAGDQNAAPPGGPANAGKTRWYFLAGAYSGLALGVKYTALIIPIAIFVVMICRGVNRISLKRIILVAAPAAIVASPWYIRNWLYQGNPIYPFLFGGRLWDTLRAEQFGRFGSGLIQDPLRLVIAPWEATITGQEGGLGYEATIGPLLLLLLPAMLLKLRRDNGVYRLVLVFCGILYAFWIIGIASSKLLSQTRLLFPAFPALSIAAAAAMNFLSELDLTRFSLAGFTRLVTGLVLALTLTGQSLDLTALNPLPFLTGFESRDEFLSRRLTPDGYYAAMQGLAKLPANDKVLFLWEPRSYYAKGAVDVVPDALLDHFADLRFRYGDPSKIATALKDQGFTHILLNRSGLNYYLTTQYDPITRGDMAVLQELLAQNFRLVSNSHAVELSADGLIASADTDSYALYEMVDVSEVK
jgi:hypothetical protein